MKFPLLSFATLQQLGNLMRGKAFALKYFIQLALKAQICGICIVAVKVDTWLLVQQQKGQLNVRCRIFKPRGFGHFGSSEFKFIVERVEEVLEIPDVVIQPRN